MSLEELVALRPLVAIGQRADAENQQMVAIVSNLDAGQILKLRRN